MTPEDARANELRRREEAQRNRGRVVEGSGTPIEGRKLDQIVSLRLDPDLLGELRRIAGATNSSVSDLLRQAAQNVVDAMTHQRVTVHVRTLVTGPHGALQAEWPSWGPTDSALREDPDRGYVTATQ